MSWLPPRVPGGRNIWVVLFDGGVDARAGQGGSAFVIMHYNTGEVVDWGFQYSGDYASNNIEEYRGMIAGLRAVKRWAWLGHDRVCVMGDSQLVVNHMQNNCKVGWKLKLWHDVARDLSWHEVISFHWIRREVNEATDFLSKEVRVLRHWWDPGKARTPYDWLKISSGNLANLNNILDIMCWTRNSPCFFIEAFEDRVKRYHIRVLEEMGASHGHRRYFLMKPRKWIMSGSERSGVYGDNTGLENEKRWNHGTIVARTQKVTSTKQHTDMLALAQEAEYTTKMLRKMDWNIGNLVRYLRQEDKERPNPSLNPAVYDRVLKGYDQLSLMKKVAVSGVKVKLKAGFVAPRPWRRNYPIDDEALPVAIYKFTKEFNESRGLLLLMGPAGSNARDMVVSPVGAVAKGGQPLCEDVRIIVGLSAPGEQSLNANTANEVPDACFGLVSEIADRILTIRWSERNGGEEKDHIKIMAMCADVDAAFYNVPISADSVRYFATRIPGTKILFLPFNLVFGWTASPGYFAIYAKAIRWLQNTMGYWIGFDWVNFWSFVWVDDIVLIEPQVDDRLYRAEENARVAVESIFGKKGWKAEKFETWSTRWESLGLLWDSQTCTVEMPEGKLRKAADMLAIVAELEEAPVKLLQSLLGKLRHLIVCAPVSKPFVQRIQQLVNDARRNDCATVSDLKPCHKDIEFWRKNLCRINFTAWPLEFFGSVGTAAAVWTIGILDGSPCVYWNGRGLTLAMRRCVRPALAESIWTLLRAAEHWWPLVHKMGIRAPRILILLGRADWVEGFNKGNLYKMKGQEAMRQLAVFQMKHRVSFRAESWKRFGNEVPGGWSHEVHKANSDTNVCQIGNSLENWMTLAIYLPCTRCARSHTRHMNNVGTRGRNSQSVSVEKYGFTTLKTVNRRPLWSDSFPIWRRSGKITGALSKERLPRCGICTALISIENWSRIIPFSPWWRKEDGRN